MLENCCYTILPKFQMVERLSYVCSVSSFCTALTGCNVHAKVNSRSCTIHRKLMYRCTVFWLGSAPSMPDPTQTCLIWTKNCRSNWHGTTSTCFQIVDANKTRMHMQVLHADMLAKSTRICGCISVCVCGVCQMYLSEVIHREITEQ